MYQVKILITFLFCLGIVTSSMASGNSVTSKSNPNLNKTYIQWDSQTRSFIIGKAKLKIGYNMVCGYYDNKAEYASFGLEQQLFKCSKVVIPVSLAYGKLFGRFDFAPLYDSIKSVKPDETTIYGNDSQSREIQGNNPYFDWYKNLGTRIYYLGNYPVLQAYLGYQFNDHQQIIAGRIKIEKGLSDDDTPWGDDGIFSPYAYWLSRDLLSGIAYRFTSQFVNARAVISSGNNPMKGYADYLDQIQSPNLKANNTPSFGWDLDLNLGHWFSDLNKSRLIIGMLDNTMSSTWVDDLEDGKRQNSVYTAALLIDWPINNDWSLEIFGQYTRYLSGLKTDSSQSNPTNYLVKDITQQGFFAGSTLSYKTLSLSYTHEIFDRFDYNVYYNWETNQEDFKGLTLQQLEDMHQSSDIINFQYQFNHYVSLLVNYQSIKNPLLWVSSILDTYPDYRFGVTFQVDF